MAARRLPRLVLATTRDPDLLGRAAEAFAALWLHRAGWRIVGRRVVTRAGEADLLALDPAGERVLVEVKGGRLARVPRPAGFDLGALESQRPGRRVGRRARERLLARARALGAHRVELVEVLVDPAGGSPRLERRVLEPPGPFRRRKARAAPEAT